MAKTNSPVKGVDGSVLVRPTGTGTLTAMLNVTAFTLEETTETLDVTNMGSTGNAREIISTFKSFSGTIDGFWSANDTNIGHDEDDATEVGDEVTAGPLLKAGDTVDFELYPRGTGTDNANYNGSAIITSISRSASFDGAVEYSLAFDGTGPLAYGVGA